MSGSGTQTTSLLAVFALADFSFKGVANFLEGQSVGLSFLNALVSSTTCLSVIVALIITTGRTRLLLYCALYYVFAFVFVALPGLVYWTSWEVVRRLATDMISSVVVSFSVLFVLLFISYRRRQGVDVRPRSP